MRHGNPDQTGFCFLNEVSRRDRLAAASLRDEAARFDRAALPLRDESALLLDALIASAEDWRMAHLSKAAFEDHRLRDDYEVAVFDAVGEMGLTGMAFAASGIDMRTALRMRLHLCGRPDVLLKAVTDEFSRMDGIVARQTNPNNRAHWKRHYRSIRPFDLEEAMRIQAAERFRRERHRSSAPPTSPCFAGIGEIRTENGYVLRRPAAAEAKAIGRSWTGDQRQIFPLDRGPSQRTPAGLAKRAVDLAGSGVLLGIFDGDGRPVGSVQALRTSPGTVEVAWHVDSEHRRRGIAEHAVRAVMPVFADQGIGRAGAICLASNEPCLGLMRKIGFSPRPDEVLVGTDLDMIGMTAVTADYEPHLSPAAPSGTI